MIRRFILNAAHIVARLCVLAGRVVRVPFRLALGLPPFYGLTISSRILQLLRLAGLYRGRIHFRVRVKTIQVRRI